MLITSQIDNSIYLNIKYLLYFIGARFWQCSFIKINKMNIFNYLRGKGNKIQTDSPTKGGKRLSASEQIYLQQIKNYIEVQGGYDILRQKLFKDIQQHYMYDSPFIQQIVILIRKKLQTKLIQTQRRCLSVIQDLVSNCGPIMNQAFNDRQFCFTLQGTIIFMNKIKNMLKANENIQRASGLFLYWHQKYKPQPHYFFHQFYNNLKQQNIPFPSTPFIKQVCIKKQKQQIIKKQIQNIQQIISSSQETAKQAQQILRNDVSKIDTNYVRLLKAKVKQMYTISSSPNVQLSSLEKQKLSQVYKRIRTTLKQIQKINEQNGKKKVIEKQKQFLQQKTINSPSKIQKQIPKLTVTESTPKKIESSPKKAGSLENQINTQYWQNDLSNTKKSSSKQIVIQDKDLLEIGPSEVVEPSSPKKAQINLFQGEYQKMKTPVKKEKIDQKLIDLQQGFQTPSSQKKLNFKQLYSQNQLSPQLKDLDLVGNSSEKSKQSIKSEEEDQFTQYK